jgi:uncharacterized protein
MLFLARLLRILAILFLVRLILRAFAGRRRAVRSAPSQPAAELVRDRVCNTFLPRDRALRARVGDREEFFCSPACRDRALGAGGEAHGAP